MPDTLFSRDELNPGPYCGLLDYVNKKFNDTIWNRTGYCVVTQSEESVLLCAPQFMIILMDLKTVLCLEVKCLCHKTTTGF